MNHEERMEVVASKLEVVIDKLSTRLAAAEAELARVREDRDRLRAALESIRDFEPDPGKTLGPYEQIAYHARVEARAAISERREGGGK